MGFTNNRSSALLLWLLGFLAVATVLGAAIPDDQANVKRQAACTTTIKRKEWRAMTTAEKADYIRAVKCLHEKTPSVTSDTVPGAVSRFDDFIGVHKVQTPYVHLVGHFLPWHRYFMYGYEKALREECQYQGGQPYWDYTLDSTNFLNSPVFDPTTGFGGDGGGMQRCVPNGPFSSWIIHLPSGTSVSRQDRCLSRQLSPQIASQWLLKTYEDQILAKPDFGHMTLALEGDTLGGMGLHGGGHFSVGGSAGDVYTSNTEPLFYLHHTNMDRIWARWQAANPALRLKDISGSIKPRSPLLNPGQGLPAGNVTLEFKVELGKLGKAVTMAEIMDTKGALVGGTGGVLCYEYV